MLLVFLTVEANTICLVPTYYARLNGRFSEGALGRGWGGEA